MIYVDKSKLQLEENGNVKYCSLMASSNEELLEAIEALELDADKIAKQGLCPYIHISLDDKERAISELGAQQISFSKAHRIIETYNLNIPFIATYSVPIEFCSAYPFEDNGKKYMLMVGLPSREYLQIVANLKFYCWRNDMSLTSYLMINDAIPSIVPADLMTDDESKTVLFQVNWYKEK